MRAFSSDSLTELRQFPLSTSAPRVAINLAERQTLNEAQPQNSWGSQMKAAKRINANVEYTSSATAPSPLLYVFQNTRPLRQRPLGH